MAGFGAIASGAGTLLSGASSLFSGIGAGKRQRNAQKWMEKMNKQNQQFQKDYTKYQNDLERENQELYWQKYNSPAAQRSAMEAAGINPFVEGSVMQPMQADSSVSGSGSPGYPTPPDYVTPGLGAIQDFGSSLSTLGARLDSIKADTDLKNAQTAKTRAETVAQENENSVFGIIRATMNEEYLSKHYRRVMEGINADWLTIEKMQDADQKAASTQELLARVKNELSQAAKTDADRENNKVITAALKNVYEADANLKGEQAKTEGAKREELGASAGLKSAQAKTEDALREGRIKINDRQARQILQDIGLSEARTLNEYEDLVRAMTNTKEVSSLWGYVDKLSARLSREDGTASYDSAADLREKLVKALAKFESED